MKQKPGFIGRQVFCFAMLSRSSVTSKKSIGLRKKSVKKMTEWSVKKEIIPHVTKITGKPSDVALISFGGMKAALALFS